MMLLLNRQHLLHLHSLTKIVFQYIIQEAGTFYVTLFYGSFQISNFLTFKEDDIILIGKLVL